MTDDAVPRPTLGKRIAQTQSEHYTYNFFERLQQSNAAFIYLLALQERPRTLLELERELGENRFLFPQRSKANQMQLLRRNGWAEQVVSLSPHKRGGTPPWIYRITAAGQERLNDLFVVYLQMESVMHAFIRSKGKKQLARFRSSLPPDLLAASDAEQPEQKQKPEQKPNGEPV